MKYYSTVKRVLTHAVTWMNLENIILSKINLLQKDKYYMIPLTRGQTPSSREAFQGTRSFTEKITSRKRSAITACVIFLSFIFLYNSDVYCEQLYLFIYYLRTSDADLTVSSRKPKTVSFLTLWCPPAVLFLTSLQPWPADIWPLPQRSMNLPLTSSPAASQPLHLKDTVILILSGLPVVVTRHLKISSLLELLPWQVWHQSLELVILAFWSFIFSRLVESC